MSCAGVLFATSAVLAADIDTYSQTRSPREAEVRELNLHERGIREYWIR